MDDTQKREFAERGYVVVPSVLTPAAIGRAMAVVDALIAESPPPDGHRGHHFYWPPVKPGDPLLDLLFESGALSVAEELLHPGTLEWPTFAQVALNIPPYDHAPGRGHIDGVTPPESSGRPSTFTMLAGFFLTDQLDENMGNLWVWPGTHWSQGAFFRERGPDALIASKGYPAIEHRNPEQVLGRAGDLLLAHYMLSHNIGGNTSAGIRRVVYYRLLRVGHRHRWRACIQDPLLEFDAVRAVVGECR
jgi:hypothetical protein